MDSSSWIWERREPPFRWALHDKGYDLAVVQEKWNEPSVVVVCLRGHYGEHAPRYELDMTVDQAKDWAIAMVILEERWLRG